MSGHGDAPLMGLYDGPCSGSDWKAQQAMRLAAEDAKRDLSPLRFHPCRDVDGVIRCPKCGASSQCINYAPGCP